MDTIRRLWREAAEAEARRQEASDVLATGGEYMLDGSLASSVEANQINARESALSEMRISQEGIYRSRVEGPAQRAYREWLTAHPGDLSGAAEAYSAAFLAAEAVWRRTRKS